MTYSIFLEDVSRLGEVLGKLALPEALPIYREGLSRSAQLVIHESQEGYLSGQVLNVLTGELRDSIEADPSGIPRYIDVGSELPQAGALHFGARGKGLRPRPYLFPAGEVASERMPAEWEIAIDQVLGAAA